MKVLIACEESQRVCIEFRKLGHEAYSCDIEPCSGGHPEWHIQSNVLDILHPVKEEGIDGVSDDFEMISFTTSDGQVHGVYGKWDLIIAFPPCTYLTSAGTRHYSLKCNTVEKVEERKKEQRQLNFS